MNCESKNYATSFITKINIQNHELNELDEESDAISRDFIPFIRKIYKK